MKKLLLFCFALASVASVQAQNYSIANPTTGTSDPYAFASLTTTEFFALPQNETYSAVQTLPFAFNFYGAAVTQYKVSDNGYLTFDTADPTSVPTNIAIPSATAPKKAIFALWDDWGLVSGTGSPDGVHAWTYGTAPQRVHVIQWVSVSHNSVVANYAWFTIRIYECGDFDVVHDWYQTTTTGVTATVGCQDATGANGVQVAGSPTFAPSGTFPGQYNTDDKVYSFNWSGVAYDVAVQTVVIDPGANNKEFMPIGTGRAVTGVLKNNGSNAITSFDLNYSVNGGAPVVMNVTGVNIASGATYNYSHSTLYNPSVGGIDAEVCVTTSNLNAGAGTDSRSCNDEACTGYFLVNGTTSPKNVLIEEFTGAWCQFCTDGAAIMNSLLSANANLIGVSVHQGDAMQISDNIRSFFAVTSYPSGSVDRSLFSGQAKVPTNRSSWQSFYTDRANDFTPCRLGFNSEYDAGTRTVSGNIKVDFSDYGPTDLRIVLYVVEDSVTGTGSGYDQINAYSNPSATPYYGASTIVGYIHRHVLRELPWGSFGAAGDFTGALTPGTCITKNFSYVIPGSMNAERTHLVAAVAHYDANDAFKSNVLNAVEIKATESNTFACGPVNRVEDLVESVNVYPNPTAQTGVVEMTFTKNTQARVSVMNLQGQEIAVLREGNFSAGVYNTSFDVTNVAPGVYFIKVDAGSKSYTRKVVVVH